MESYGKLVGGQLQLSSIANPCLLGARSELTVAAPAGTKRVAFAAIPAFDQTTHYVYQLPPVDGKSGISVGVAVGEVTPDDDAENDPMMPFGARTAPVEGSAS